MAENEFTATAALADAWATMDGQGAQHQQLVSSGLGSGYDEDAAEMIVRLERRGYTIVPAGTIAALEARAITLDRLLADREGQQSNRRNPASGHVAASVFAAAADGWEKEKRAHEITARQRDQGLRELEAERKLRREALAGWEADKKLHTKTTGELAHLRGSVLALSSSIRLAADDLGRVAT